MDAAPRFRDNQPHTVQVVAIFLWVVWGQHGPRRSREVEETRDCEGGRNIGNRQEGEM